MSKTLSIAIRNCSQNASEPYFFNNNFDVDIDSTLNAVFCEVWTNWKKEPFNFEKYNASAVILGKLYKDLLKPISSLECKHIKDIHYIVSPKKLESSSRMVEMVLLELHIVMTKIPDGLMQLSKAARNIHTLDIADLCSDSVALNIVSDFRICSAVLQRPKLLHTLMREHPMIAALLSHLCKHVTSKSPTRLPPQNSLPNIPLGANYAVDFESAMDEDEPESAVSAMSAAGIAGAARTTSSSNAITSDFLRSAMQQATASIPARVRFSEQLATLREMGIADEEYALRILEQHDGNLETCIETLFS